MDKVQFKNGYFRVMQISDAQDLQWARGAMIRMLDNACEKLQPDLIVFTGDNILGNHIRDMRFGTRERRLSRRQEYAVLKTSIYNILNIPLEHRIPFAVIFGNHDDINSFTKQEQADIYRACPLNIGLDNDGELCGTYRLPVYSSDGNSVKMNFWMVDTARYDRETGKCVQSITKAQTDWFVNESRKAKTENGGEPCPSLMFMHIPFKRASELCEECDRDSADCEKNGKYYRLSSCAEGVLGEKVTPLKNDSGFYEAVLDDGSVDAIVSGHNHLNSFEGTVDSIRFIATPGASFRSYGSRLRGVRIFDFREDSPGNFYTRAISYNELCGKNAKAELDYFLSADNTEKAKNAAIGMAAAVAAAAIIQLR